VTIAQVRAAAADAVTATGAVRCLPYVGPINPPCAFITRRERDPRLVFSGVYSEYPFAVIVFMSRADDRSAQKKLDALFEQSGNGSIKYRLESDADLATLLSAGQTVEVTRIGGEEIAELSGVEYVVSTVDFEVVF
jgi:hypothetical protein